MTVDDALFYVNSKLKQSGLLGELAVKEGRSFIRVTRIEGPQVSTIDLHPQILDGASDYVQGQLDAAILTALKAIVKEPIYRK